MLHWILRIKESVMAVGLRDFDAFMSYDAEVSARRTKVALAVVAEKDGTGLNRNTLTIVDLKQASIWQRIKLWWNGSLDRKTIGNHLSLHVQNWSKQIGDNKQLRADFELQCAKLHRKILFTHKPEWKLQVQLQYPDLARPEAAAIQGSTILTFDRLTTNQEILDCVAQMRFSLTTGNMRLTPRFSDIFEERETSGDFPTSVMGNFLKETDEGKDRTCKISFKAPSQQKLMEKIAKQSAIQGRLEQQRVYEHERAVRHEMRARARADAANAAFAGAVMTTSLALALGGGRCHRHR